MLFAVTRPKVPLSLDEIRPLAEAPYKPGTPKLRAHKVAAVHYSTPSIILCECEWAASFADDQAMVSGFGEHVRLARKVRSDQRVHRAIEQGWPESPQAGRSDVAQAAGLARDGARRRPAWASTLPARDGR